MLIMIIKCTFLHEISFCFNFFYIKVFQEFLVQCNNWISFYTNTIISAKGFLKLLSIFMNGPMGHHMFPCSFTSDNLAPLQKSNNILTWRKAEHNKHSDGVTTNVWSMYSSSKKSQLQMCFIQSERHQHFPPNILKIFNFQFELTSYFRW